MYISSITFSYTKTNFKGDNFNQNCEKKPEKEAFENKNLQKPKEYDWNFAKNLAHIIEPVEPLKPQYAEELFKDVLSNSNIEIENTIKNTDFAKYGEKGIPIIFKRKDFIKELNEKLEKLDIKKQEEILGKIEIELTEDKKGYDGVLCLKNLDKSDKAESEIYNLIHKFIYENKVITEDENLNKILNSLIKGMPEWVNVIGKKQHGPHNKTIDSHILSVFKYIFLSPLFDELSNKDMINLKLAVLMHDIAKPDSRLGVEHPYMSSLYADEILKKYNYPAAQKKEITEIIANHHWLYAYNTRQNDEIVFDIASKMRSGNNFLLSRVMTEADLKGCGAVAFKQFGGALSEDHLKTLKKLIDTNRKTGNLLFSTLPVRDEIPFKFRGDKAYRVLDLTKFEPENDVSDFGFAKGTKLKDINFFTHAADKESIENIMKFDETGKSIALSTSYINALNPKTYDNVPYGVILDVMPYNIISVADYNMISGCKKDFQYIVDELKMGNPNNFAKTIQEELLLTNDEYGVLFNALSGKKYLSCLDDFEIVINKKLIEGEKIKMAIEAAQKKLQNNLEHNEVVVYCAKPYMFFAKNNNFNEVSEEILEISEKYNLPICILGSNHKSL